jgi:hypothetical protein
VSKSATPVPSRRYSGFIATPKSRPACSPELRSRAGITISSVVPGSTVLRTTTVWRREEFPSDSPMSAQTRSSAERSIDPCAPDGVPTHSSETSVSRTA